MGQITLIIGKIVKVKRIYIQYFCIFAVQTV